MQHPWRVYVETGDRIKIPKSVIARRKYCFDFFSFRHCFTSLASWRAEGRGGKRACVREVGRTTGEAGGWANGRPTSRSASSGELGGDV